MAKNTRSGLGRGLNSLMGSIYNEAIPEEKPEPIKHTQPTQSVQVVKPTQPVPRVMVEGEDVPSESIKAVKMTPEQRAEQARENEIHSVIVEDLNQAVSSEDISISVVSEQSTDEISIDLIEPNPDQPRTNFKREELEELAASIEKDGLLQPILVRSIDGERYQIIAGERRWQACKLIDLKTVPVRIKEADNDQALELALVENLQRSDLNPIEEAYGYRRMMERRGMTQAEVAQAMSKGRSTVANALRLLDLPEDAQQLLFEEKITAGHARAILSIPTQEGRQKLTDKLLQETLSVREAEAIARLMSGKTSAAKQSRAPLPDSYKKVATELKKVLSAPVRVKSVKGKNKIEIEFKDEEDLKRLFNQLSSE
ncbi:ParB/RepB/Spo0J family partition protein [Adlercreutzia sp. ZJ138]|uniref:ParB/RepB/Spo0J family partition protein n=1 Tax=Adlercreutzia sp. ZJ138 TaxID=2709405 RepID=UPI001F14C37D|nr:ParB/RepB/Spo0J family partition protein [Adlercreutzia sp. ZJ138]